MWRHPEGIFVAAMVWPSTPKPDASWQNDEEKKKAFGIELARDKKPFDAGLAVFPDETGRALWVSQNWLSDPVVIGSKDAYSQVVETNQKLLDKDALSVKLLKFAEEKDPTGRFYLCEAKDRLAAYALYAKVRGFTDKIEVDASTNITNNELRVVLVKSPEKEKSEKLVTTIDNEEDEKIDPLPLNIKLVASR